MCALYNCLVTPYLDLRSLCLIGFSIGIAQILIAIIEKAHESCAFIVFIAVNVIGCFAFCGIPAKQLDCSIVYHASGQKMQPVLLVVTAQFVAKQLLFVQASSDLHS